ncbi:WD40 repeat-like protein [Didymella exigua CBS 183.55]|uniref:WD40 repeat-like protein n=1 Tax=Didymella exigua CBS 183.55 TaxID=1150837 RepID=A0A6A5RAQ3_9PLEO|nr:WD40 repeat-like protein [Didymella exigua CBS 183.55]KAF1924633.1 WD40 repeat-like protein [Didymella exigua CBS 183.55]
MALSSNVVNYLVWRYLQEAGFGNAALQLSRCWLRDPDSLPFAKHVSSHALVRILQDGMEFDRLHAKASNTSTQYDFGTDHGHPYSKRNGELLTLDKGIPAHQLAAEAANGAPPDPPPKKSLKRKKQAKTNGVPAEPRLEPSEAELNGDAMELDHNGTAHAATGNSLGAESEPPPSEAESPSASEIPISTLTIGADALIQTDDIKDLAPATTFIPVPAAFHQMVEHTSWGPEDAPLLLSAGKSVLQLHNVAAASEAGRECSVQTMDLPIPVSNFDITALCWQSEGEVIVSAREQCHNELGEKMTMDKLIKVVGDTADAISSTAGLVTTLRWNAGRELLLSISTDGEKGSIKIWKSDSDSIPAWTDFTATQIYDAYWISDSAFVVCGTELFKIYDVDGDSLTTQRTLDTQVTWETVKFDPWSGIIAALGIRGQEYYLGILHPNDSINLQVHEYPDRYPNDLDFRIHKASSPTTNGTWLPSTLLATCSLSGHARIWDANRPFDCVRRLDTTDHSQAFKTAFSPDGALLAAAGPDAVTVWDVEKREIPVASWRAKDFSALKWNPGADGEFNLGWDHDSSRISIALGNQIAIIPIPR